MVKIKAFLASHGEKLGLGAIVLFLIYSIQASLLTPADVRDATSSVDTLESHIRGVLSGSAGGTIPALTPILPVLQVFYREPPDLDFLQKPEWTPERRGAARADGRLPFPQFADYFLYLKGVISARVDVRLKEGEWSGWLRPADLPESFRFAGKIEPVSDPVCRNPEDYFAFEFEDDADRHHMQVRFLGRKANGWDPQTNDPSLACPQLVLNYFDEASPGKPAGSFLLLIERPRSRPRLYPVRNVRSGIPNPLRPGEVLVEWEADPRTTVTLKVAYRVERREAAARAEMGPWRAQTEMPITATRYLDATCEPQKRYEYRIQACTPDHPCDVPAPR